MEQVESMPYDQTMAGAAVGGNAVYVIGGNVFPGTTVFKYYPISNLWEEFISIQKARGNKPCVFLLEDKLCVAGGDDRNVCLVSMTCIKWNDGSGLWTLSDFLPFPLSYISCVTVGNFVILTGGDDCTGTPFMGTSSAFKWQSGYGWTQVASMGMARQRHCSVSDGIRYVYVLGGDKGFDTMERYDTQLNEWIYMANMPEILVNHACIYMSNTIIVTGGLNGKKTIYLYFVDNDIWELSITTLPKGIDGHSMAALPWYTPVSSM